MSRKGAVLPVLVVAGFAAAAFPVRADALSPAAQSGTGQIKGVVRAADDGAPLQNVLVEIVGTAGATASSRKGTHAKTHVYSKADGSYALKNLPPTSAGYYVCFDPATAEGGDSPTGYMKQCWNHVVRAEPSFSGLTPVPVTANSVTSGVNADLQDGGSIAGTVTDAATGAPLAGVGVRVQGTSGSGFTVTDSTGEYRVRGLNLDDENSNAPGSKVCFDTNVAPAGSPAADHVGQCWHNLPYLAGGTTEDAPRVHITSAGQQVTGIDAALADDASAHGTISGSVTDAVNGQLLTDYDVIAYDPSTGAVVGGQLDVSGKYGNGGDLSVPASSSGWLVCVSASHVQGAPAKKGYRDQCWRLVSWSGPPFPPSRATPVPVPADGTVTGINFALARS